MSELQQIAEFIENDEVHPGELFGDPTLPSVTGLNLEPVDKIDHVVEPASGSRHGYSFWQWQVWPNGFCRCRFLADQHCVTLLGDELKPPGEVAYRRNERPGLIGVPRQTGSRRGLWRAAAWRWRLVLDRACLLLVDLGDLLNAEINEKQARSIKYQLTIAKLPLAKDLDDFQFEGTLINQDVVRIFADQHCVTLLGDELAAGEVTHERLVNRRAFKLGSRRGLWRAAAWRW